MNSIENEIFCIFTTDLGESFHLPPAKHAMAASLTNIDLNDVIKQLLSLHNKITDSRFDFLINGELLIGSIKSHLVKMGLTGERTVEIVFTRSIGKPQMDTSVDVTNGISRIFVSQEQSKSVICGSFNNLVSVFDSELKPKASIELSKFFEDYSQTILAYDYQQTLSKNVLLVSNDFGDFSVLEFSKNFKNLNRVTTEINSSPISSFSLNPMEDLTFLTGDNEGYLKIWSFENGIIHLRAERDSAHNGKVLKSCFATTTDVYSIGFDDSFKIFDVNSLVNVYFVYFKDCLPTTFDFSLRKNAILTGHVNGTIRLFDERIRDKTTKRIFKSHNNYLSSIKINPENDNVFISSDYTGNVKVWDLRGDFPVYTIESSSDHKIFDLAWLNEKEFLSGNSEGLVMKHSFN